MKYTYWPDAAEAEMAEKQLARQMIKITEMTESRQEQLYQEMLSHFMLSMNIKPELDAIRIIANINPMKAIWKSGRKDAFYSICKRNLPFSGDGLIINDNFNGVKDRPFYFRSEKRTGYYESILQHKSKSPLIEIPTASELVGYMKAYANDTGNLLNPELTALLSDPDFDFSNRKAWLSRSICTEELCRANISVLGLDAMLECDDLTLKQKINDFKERVDNHPHVKAHAIMLVLALSEKDNRHRSFVTLCQEVRGSDENRPDFERIVLRIKRAAHIFESILPKEAGKVLGELVFTASDMNYGFEGGDRLREVLTASFTTDDLHSRLAGKHCKRLSQYLDNKDLLENAGVKVLRAELMDEMGL